MKNEPIREMFWRQRQRGQIEIISDIFSGRRLEGKLKRRFMVVVRGDIQIVGGRGKDAEDRERWRTMICCDS